MADGRPREAWILAGTLDGAAAYPHLDDDLGGISHGLRLAGECALAGIKRVVIVWAGGTPPPDVSAIATDPRLASRASLEIVTSVPTGDDGDPILLVRGDRVFHRDVPKLVAQAYRPGAALSTIADASYDAVFATTRAHARVLAEAAPSRGGFAAEIDRLRTSGEVATAEPPYMGFTVAAPDAKALRRAEKILVRSLRKAADGIAAKAINRSLSLPLTHLLCRTKILPNHVTLVALACALAGGLVISRGGYWAGVVGMLFVEAGSIIDGIDGELARLRFQFSQAGQWLDTVVDDIANIAYATGTMISLDMAGQTWAVPVGVAAIICFILTQSTQYALIRFVYKSGDLAAIPWAFQSTEFLSQRPTGFVATVKATIPKLLKRDFVVTLMLVFAIFGRLEPILLVFSGGAFVFFVVFFVQFARNFKNLPR